MNRNKELIDIARQLRVLANAMDRLVSEPSNPEDHALGYCPECGSPGVTRERRPGGNDTCTRGHVYPSKDAVYYYEDGE